MDLQCWPLVKWEGKWSIPYPVLQKVWEDMVESGAEKETFYDGWVKTFDDFVFYLQTPTNLVILVVDMDNKKIVAFGVLNNINNSVGYAHFSFTNGFIKGAGELVIKYWGDILDDKGDKIIRVLIGITPESYEKVHHIIQTWGFKIIGTIPNACPMYYKGRREGAVISYLEIGG